jgi:hypothetical protein
VAKNLIIKLSEDVYYPHITKTIYKTEASLIKLLHKKYEIADISDIFGFTEKYNMANDMYFVHIIATNLETNLPNRFEIRMSSEKQVINMVNKLQDEFFEEISKKKNPNKPIYQYDEYIGLLKDRIGYTNSKIAKNYYSNETISYDVKELSKDFQGQTGFFIYTKVDDYLIIEEVIPHKVERAMQNQIEKFGWNEEDDEYVNLMIIGIITYYSDNDIDKVKSSLRKYNNYLKKY